jgi:hypothetical protein
MSYTLRNKVAEYGGLTLSQRYILETLATYANDDGASCFPAIDRIAYDTGAHRKTVWEVMKELRRRGVLVAVTAKERRTKEYRIVLAALPPRAPFTPPNRRTRGGVGPPPSPAEFEDRGGAAPPPDGEGRGGVGPRSWRRGAASGGGLGPPNPVSDPVIHPVKGAAAPLPTNEEGFVKAVIALWRAARKKHGIERFTDGAAIKNMKDAARRAWTQGCTLDDMTGGIATRASDPHATPWYVDEWARDARAQRTEREALERRIRERREEDELREAEWQALQREYPGLTRAEIVRRRTVGT